MHRLGVGVVLGALVLVGVAAGAKEPQFRDSVTVQGTVGGSTGEHHLTFSGPVALPGVSLGPGTYIFRRPAGNVLQVTNANRVPYAMLMTRPIRGRSGPIATRSSSARPERRIAAPHRGVVRARRIDRPAADLQALDNRVVG